MKRGKVLFVVASVLILAAFFVTAVFPGTPEIVVWNQDQTTRGLHFYNMFSEDSGGIYNITVNNTWGGGELFNISQINITLPNGIVFNASSNYTNVVGTDVLFNHSNGALSWWNGTTSGFLINGSGINGNTSWFAFNATAANPGLYNITVSVHATNGTNFTTYLSVTINDTTAPSTVTYQGLTPANNSNISKGNLFVNLSLTDNGNITFVNITLFNSSQDLWNSSGSNTSTYQWFNFSNLAEGTWYFNVTVNDSYSNKNTSFMRKVFLDTTAPSSVNMSCTDSVTVGGTVTCTCVAADAFTNISGVSGFDTNPSTSAIGTFTMTCTATDYAGNTATGSDTYTVTAGSGGGSGSSSGGGGSSTSSTIAWTRTFAVTNAQFEGGYTKELGDKERLKLSVGSSTHYVGVKTLTSSTATIEVSSTPQESIMSVGEVAKFDLDADNFYDLKVTLNSILSGKADVSVLEINEPVPAPEPAASPPEPAAAPPTAAPLPLPEEPASLAWLWIVLGVVVVVIVVVVIVGKQKASGKGKVSKIVKKK